MQELKKFKTLNAARREYISNSVAIHWLTNAEKVIARGGSPMKLSALARQQIKNVLGDLDELTLLPSSSGITRMENNCLRFAKYLLRNGRFPTVLTHFSDLNSTARAVGTYNQNPKTRKVS